MRKGLKILLPIALCFIALFVNTLYASNIFMVEITAESLNVRERPSTKGKIISSFQKGEKIVATTVNSEWVMVLVKGRIPGYISSNYIKIIKVISSDDDTSSYDIEEESKCNADLANIKLSISDVELKCKEDLFGNGYKSCSVWFYVAIISHCGESMTANVDCEAEFKYETRDGFMPSRAYESSSDSIYLINGHGNGQIEVYWRPREILDSVIMVNLNNGSCSITSVYNH